MAAVNGRQASDASSSPSSDFYDAGASAHKASVPEHDKESRESDADANRQGIDGDEDPADSSSEMDMSDTSSGSVSSIPETNGASHAGAKRKLDDTRAEHDGTQDVAHDFVKKRRMSPPVAATSNGIPLTAGLPVEVWQHTFLNLPPAMLSRCLRVCKTFNHYLTGTKPLSIAKKCPTSGRESTRLRVLDSETIWINSRKHAYPAMPKPVTGRTDLQMLQLVGAQTCQTCGKVGVRPPATNVFNAGPGENGVRVVWPFRVRICGACFQRDALRDVDLLGAASPVARLTSGLPHAFRSQDGHFVPDIVRQTSGIPGHLRIQKTFHIHDVKKIADDWDEVKAFGDGAAEEWRKGLVQRGKAAMADASRWERWEATMPHGTVLAEALREQDPTSFPKYVGRQHAQAGNVNGVQPIENKNGNTRLPHQEFHFEQVHAVSPPVVQSAAQTIQHVQRTIRNAQEVDAARQARRADIERRCMELNPPLESNVLQHIKAFQNTMQITTPLTNGQWENMLKPRILEERETAELLEHQRMQQMAALQAAIPSTISDETYVRPAKEVYDREYEQAQDPLRARLGEYADDYINGHWHQGRSLDRESCALFAVDVLLHVRQRYLADKELGILPRGKAQSVKSAASKQSTPPLEPFLSLDNMKWVYDNKVRSYTDHLRRELFICAGCAEDFKPKWFAFEGLIQHYGAKHTHTFSKGNVVVHWQTAEWPEESPFHPDPSHWVKAERKSVNHKSHGRQRGTPQAIKDGPHGAASLGSLLSENPLFSSTSVLPANHNGYHAGNSPYNGNGHAPMPYSYSYPSTQASVDMSQEAQVTKVSGVAREVWDKLDGVKEILECVRMQTVIHHVIARFTEHFGQHPTLDLLTDALATNMLMRPIKNAHALACKLCVASQTDGGASYQSYFQRIRNMKVYNASSLITHFKIVHQPHGVLQWDKDMIELPEIQLISDLIHTPGMDDEKLGLIAEAFPDVFPSPLPKIGVVIPDVQKDVGPDSGLANRLVKKYGKKSQQPSKKKRGVALNNGRDGSSETLPEPKEDEYDPRRPMFPADDAEPDMSRFDTDLARKDVPPTASASPAFNLAPETLAALSNLSTLTVNKPTESDRRSRSPSVGRGESQNTNGHTAAIAYGLPNGQPDISAILASLTGQTAAAPSASTPTYAGSHRASQTPMQPYSPYAQPGTQASPTYVQADARRPSTRYVSAGSYRGSAEASPARFDAQDAHTAYNRNSQHFAQNAHAGYTEPGTIYAPQPQQQQSPPRYRVVYENEHGYTQPHTQQFQPYPEAPRPLPQYRPADGEIAPIQYRYERNAPAPRPVYVDQFGRPLELVPIDNAPAPVQYMPHPFELQQQQQQHHSQQYGYAYPHGQAYAPQPVYYEQASQPAFAGRYPYEDDRGSVPRA